MIDGWVDKTASYSITIAEAITVDENSDDLNSLKVGEDFYALLTSDEFTTENYTEIKWGVAPGSALPDGLTINEKTGEISGTPTTAGTYQVTVRLTATQGSSSDGGNKDSKSPFGMVQTFDMGGNKGGSTTTTTEVDYVITLVVAEADAPAVEEPDYVTGDEVKDMIDDAIANLDKDTEESGGCSGNIGSTVAMVGASLAVVAAALVLSKKKNKDN